MRPISAAELLTEFELAPELAETSGAEIAAPPTALHAKDLKSGYNVTTPAQCWLYWNTLQHRRSAAEVFDISLMLARRAMARGRAEAEARHSGDELCGTRGACTAQQRRRSARELGGAGLGSTCRSAPSW